MGYCSELMEKILNGYEITKGEAIKLYNEPKEVLYKSADIIREIWAGSKVDLCSIINGKSGRCSEDCSYCAQSIHFKTGVTEYKLLSYEEIKAQAKENEIEGVDRFL